MADVKRQISDWIDSRKKECFPHISIEEWRHSQFYRLLKDCASAAIDETKCTDIGEIEYSHLYKCENLIYNIAYVTKSYGHDVSPNFWRHSRINTNKLEENSQPEIDKGGLEDCVSQYLSMPVRSKLVDSCLVDMLIACEFLAYVRQAVGGRGGFMRGNGPIGWLLTRLVSAVVLLGLAAFIEWISNAEWATWVAVGLVVIFLIETVITFVLLPFGWRKQNQHNRRVGELINAMSGAYFEMESAGPISARHIREICQSATVIGVVWPAPLFVLLDNVIDRGGTLTGRFG